MSKSRELFVPIPIEAKSGNQTKVIGYITDRKRYTPGGGCIIPRKVFFHFGDPKTYSDSHFFENGTLKYQAIGVSTPEYITDVYAQCARMKEISPDEFIEKVLEAYVMTEIGF